MLNAGYSPIRFPATQQPLIVVVIDTEEEFDWHEPFSRASTSVSHIRAQGRALDIFARFGLKPLFVIDYPVASQPAGYEPLHAWAQDGRCEIGTHLHPWVNPPCDEPVTNRNSYPGNLAADLEREKLARLTELIEQRFGTRPRIYRAGRYGVGRNTTATLEALGYEIDTSVVPRSDFSAEEGPDFTACGLDPYWFGSSGNLLEVPLTVGWTGLLADAGASLQRACRAEWGRQFRLQGLLSRAGLFDRVRLTPEGISLDEMRRLTRTMLKNGHRLFNFTYHSPSLEPGHTPYVRSGADLQRFVETIERYLEFFVGEIGGRATTLGEVRSLCAAMTTNDRRDVANAMRAGGA